MSLSKSGNKTHDDACALAEGTRHAAVAGASQATVKTAEIAYYRACLASAKATGLDQGPFIHALWTLGLRDP